MIDQEKPTGPTKTSWIFSKGLLGDSKWRIPLIIVIFVFAILVLFYIRGNNTTPKETANDTVSGKPTLNGIDNNTTTNPVSEFEVKSTVTSVTCKIEGLANDGKIPISLEAHGTLSGPVKTRFVANFHANVVRSAGPQESLSCGSWSKIKNGLSDIDECTRKEGQPETTSWSMEEIGAFIYSKKDPPPEFFLGEIFRPVSASNPNIMSVPDSEGGVKRAVPCE